MPLTSLSLSLCAFCRPCAEVCCLRMRVSSHHIFVLSYAVTYIFFSRMQLDFWLTVGWLLECMVVFSPSEGSPVEQSFLKATLVAFRSVDRLLTQVHVLPEIKPEAQVCAATHVLTSWKRLSCTFRNGEGLMVHQVQPIRRDIDSRTAMPLPQQFGSLSKWLTCVTRAASNGDFHQHKCSLRACSLHDAICTNPRAEL